MSNELTIEPAPFGPGQQPARGMSLHANVAAVSIETERAIAEARGQIQVAQMFPRDVMTSRAEFMEECDNIEFATAAIYSVPQAGGKVSGPSIRFAEEGARCYGHMEYGHRELSRSDGKSEIEVYAWDKQKNNMSKRQITVLHVLDTREGPKKLRDQRDIDNKIANIASKQIRGRILALIPKSFVESGIARCKATIAGGGGVPLKQRVTRMTDAFVKLGVTADILKAHLGHSLDSVDADELVELTAIHNAIKGGDKIGDHFQRETVDEAPATSGLAATAKKGTEAAAAAAVPAKPVAAVKASVTEKKAPAPQEEAASKDPVERKSEQKVSKTTDEPAPVVAAQSKSVPAETVSTDSASAKDDGDFF